MICTLEGRIATSKEKVSKNGNKYYLSTMVQGEGTQFVETIFIKSNKKLEIGANKVNCKVTVFKDRINVYVVENIR